jgi:hypothetical protein
VVTFLSFDFQFFISQSLPFFFMQIVKRAALAAVLALAAPAAFAQTVTLDGISNMRRSLLSPIYAGNEVKGYVMFARGDKADRKNDNYLLDLYDQDLKKVSSITMQKPSGRYTLLKNTFNGSAFAFYFYNGKEETLEIETYDTSLQKLGSKVIGELTKSDLRAVQMQTRFDDPAKPSSARSAPSPSTPTSASLWPWANITSLTTSLS